MSQVLDKVVFDGDTVPYTESGTLYRSPCLASTHQVVFFYDTKCSHLSSLDISRFGDGCCDECDTLVLWSPNYVAEGLYGDGTLNWILASLESALHSLGIYGAEADAFVKEHVLNHIGGTIPVPSAPIVQQHLDADGPAKLYPWLVAKTNHSLGDVLLETLKDLDDIVDFVRDGGEATLCIDLMPIPTSDVSPLLPSVSVR